MHSKINSGKRVGMRKKKKGPTRRKLNSSMKQQCYSDRNKTQRPKCKDLWREI